MQGYFMPNFKKRNNQTKWSKKYSYQYLSTSLVFILPILSILLLLISKFCNSAQQFLQNTEKVWNMYLYISGLNISRGHCAMLGITSSHVRWITKIKTNTNTKLVTHKLKAKWSIFFHDKNKVRKKLLSGIYKICF